MPIVALVLWIVVVAACAGREPRERDAGASPDAGARDDAGTTRDAGLPIGTWLDPATTDTAFRWLAPEPRGELLIGVFPDRDGTLYAVGTAGTVLRRRDGVVERAVFDPRIDLFDVDRVGDEIWIVGTESTLVRVADDDWTVERGEPEHHYTALAVIDVDAAVLLRSDGAIVQRTPSSTVVIPSPSSGPYYSVALDATAFDDVWTSDWNDGVHHWDGTEWATYPDVGEVVGIHMEAPTDVWAIGHTISHWNGVEWTDQETEEPGAGPTPFQTWSAIAVDAAAAQWFFSCDGDIVVRRTDDAWERIYGPSPPTVPSTRLPCVLDAASDGSGGIWAVGVGGFLAAMTTDDVDVVTGPATARYLAGPSIAPDGGVWLVTQEGRLARADARQVVDAPDAPSTFGRWGVLVVAAVNDAWHFGRAGTAARFDGDEWLAYPTGAEQALLAGHASSTTNVWAVGYNGAAVHWNGVDVELVDAGTTEHLADVWARDAQDVWVAAWAETSTGGVLRFDGVEWSRVARFDGMPVFHVGGDSDDVWVATELDIHHFDGAEWSVVPFLRGFPSAIFALHAVEGGVWATVDGYAGFWDGVEWTNVDVVGVDDLRAVWSDSGDEAWGLADGDFWSSKLLRFEDQNWSVAADVSYGLERLDGAAGLPWVSAANGTLVRFDGARWTQVGDPRPASATEIVALADDQVVVVSGHDAVHVWDGESWSLRQTGLLTDFTAAARVPGADDVVLVGTGGVVVRVGTDDVEALPVPSLADLTAVMVADDGAVWVGDAAGETHRFRDAQWETFFLPMPSSVGHLAAASAQRAWAIANWRLHELVDDEWRELPLPGSPAIEDVDFGGGVLRVLTTDGVAMLGDELWAFAPRPSADLSRIVGDGRGTWIVTHTFGALHAPP